MKLDCRPSRGARRASLSLVFAAGATVTGCFSYVAVPISAVAPQEEVRVRITDNAGARLVKDLGIYTTQLDGEFAEHGDSVSITVPILREYRGQMLEGANQALYLGKTEVVEVRQRKFSKPRTVLASVGTVAVFVALVKSIIAVADPNDNDGVLPPPPPPGQRVPVRRPYLIRIPFP